MHISFVENQQSPALSSQPCLTTTLVKTTHCVIFRGHFSSRQNCTQFIIGKLWPFFQARLLDSGSAGGSVGTGDGSSTASSSSSSMMSTSSKCLSKFSSPFKRRKNKAPKNQEINPIAGASNATESSFEQLLLAPDNSHREEMLRLFILKLDEEANYFQVSASPEEELCDCQKCQVTHSLFC